MARDHPNEQQGEFATEHVAAEYDLAVENDLDDWYDAVDESTGTKYEVKSTQREYSGEYSEGATGRFRLWEDQHRSLVAAEAADGQTAYYAFVVLEEVTEDSFQVEHVVRRRPSTVTGIVDGNWNDASHEERDSRQHKVPWYEVVHR